MIILFVVPPKFGRCFVFNFSWDLQSPQEKFKTMLMQNFGGTTKSIIKSRLSLIVRVNVVLNRTVVVDSDWRFDNLCGSHLQSLNMTTTQVVQTSVTVNNNSPIQDYVHLEDQTQPTFEMTPGFKPFTNLQQYLDKFTSLHFISCFILRVYFGNWGTLARF